MKPLRTSDNNNGNCPIENCHLNNLSGIGNKSLALLKKENPDLLIFPTSFKNKIEKETLFTIINENLITNNMMGFIGINETRLTISSRFHKDEKDYFLHYMLRKVFCPTLLDFKFDINHESIWDIFLIYLFPNYLKKALKQGFYKEYTRKQFNDANLKGAIDINVHIKTNIPFGGKIAYSTREYTFDNKITQLIRHTQEYIKNGSFSNILSSDKEIRDSVNLINFNTNSYNKTDRQKVIQNNLKSLNHPYYTEYETLRRICVKILRREGLSYGKQDKDKVYGIVFDGAWLWEEYLNTILKEIDFIHPENKNNTNGIYLFKENKSNIIFPDFYSKDKTVVLDAKYKRLERWDPDNVTNSDIYQVITYLHCLQSKIGGFVFPLEENDNCKDSRPDKIGELEGYGGTLFKIGLLIPKESTSYSDFTKQMEKTESWFLNKIPNYRNV